MLDDLLGNAAHAQELLLELGGGADYHRVAQVHRVTEEDTRMQSGGDGEGVRALRASSNGSTTSNLKVASSIPGRAK